MARPASDIPERIIDAARDLFLARGVDGASLRSIAKAAETSIGMIYYHFQTKDELFMAVVEDVYEGLLVDLEEALDPALSFEERVQRTFARFGRMSTAEATTLSLVLREALVSQERLSQVAERFKRGHVPLLLQLLADGARTGAMKPDLPPLSVLLSMVTLSMFAQVIRRRAPDAGLPLPLTPAGELAESLCEILLRGISSSAT